MEWLIVLILPVLAGAIAGRIARDKGRSPTLWRWLSVLFCPLLVVLMLLPSKTSATYRAGFGVLSEAIGAAAVVLILAVAAIYTVSGGSGDKPTDPVPGSNCDQAEAESKDLANSLAQAFSDGDLQLAMAQNDSQALCRKLAGIMSEMRRLRAEAGKCPIDDPFSSIVGPLLKEAAANCQ